MSSKPKMGRNMETTAAAITTMVGGMEGSHPHYNGQNIT